MPAGRGLLSAGRAGAFFGSRSLGFGRRCWRGGRGRVPVAARQPVAQVVYWVDAVRLAWGRGVRVGQIYLLQLVRGYQAADQHSQADHVALEVVVCLHYHKGRHAEGALDKVKDEYSLSPGE